MMMTPAQQEKSHFNSENFIAQKIPYAYLLDEHTVETKSGHLLQIIRLEGYVAETKENNMIDQEKELRNGLLKSITDSSTALYFHTIRKKETRHLNGTYAVSFAKKLHEKWQARLDQKQFFVNEYYITVVKKPPTGKIRRLADVMSALSGKVNEAARAQYREESHQDLNNTTRRILSHLSHYGARLLGSELNNKTGTIFSDVLSFLSELINLEHRQCVLPNMDLAHYLPCKRLFFDKTSGTLAARGLNNQSCYAAILSLKEYDKGSIAGMLDPILDIKIDMIITQSFSFIDKGIARKRMQEQQRNQLQSDENSVSEAVKIDHTLDELGSSTVAMGEHYLSILCKADSLSMLEKSLTQLDSAFNAMGILAVREDVGIKPAFFAMLPGNQAYIARRAVVSSLNMASFASLHNYSSGKFKDNHWGEAVTLLETISGTPFFFNFHVLDVANTFLIGPMGSGKTLLEAFLLSESMKFGGRLIVLDKDRGLELFIRAMEGRYSLMQAGERTGFAPFQMDDTLENRYFLTQLLRKMASEHDQILSDEDTAKIQQAVAGAFQLPKSDRILRHIVPFLGMRKLGSLRMRFDRWVNEGDVAWVFDNEIDHLSLDVDILGFDLSSVLNDPVVCPLIYFYLFHRIAQKMDGTKTRIIVAEGWRALQEETFRKQIQEWSSTPRKKNAFLVFDTQSPDDIAASPIGCKMIQETVTQIYFANPNARSEHYVTQFGLNEKEYQIVKNLDKRSHYFLLKQGKNSAVVRADLSGWKNEIAILSGRTQHLKKLDEIRKTVGDHPQKWMPLFLDTLSQEKPV